MTERLLTTREVMAWTSLSRNTLWRLRRTDPEFGGAVVQITTARIVWKESVIAAWLEKRAA